MPRTDWHRRHEHSGSTNLTASPAFVTLARGIEGQGGTTRFVDSNAGGAGPFFYRVGCEQPVNADERERLSSLIDAKL